MKKLIITTLALLSFAGCSEENPHNFRTKDLLGSISGNYNMVLYTGYLNGKKILDHNEGRLEINKRRDSMIFIFRTFQHSPIKNGNKEIPSPGMICGFHFKQELNLNGKAYNVNFETTGLATVLFYNEDPDIMYIMTNNRVIEGVELTIKAAMKEAGTVEGSVAFDCDMEIDFEVEGDKYHFNITKVSPYFIY